MPEYRYRPWMRPLEFDRPTWDMLKPFSENIYAARIFVGGTTR